jgi:phosphate transport system substrate-binding protein
MYREAKDAAASTEALKFFAWAYANGAPLAQELDYVPLPASLVKQVEQTWRTGIMSGGKALWTGK